MLIKWMDPVKRKQASLHAARLIASKNPARVGFIARL